MQIKQKIMEESEAMPKKAFQLYKNIFNIKKNTINIIYKWCIIQIYIV